MTIQPISDRSIQARWCKSAATVLAALALAVPAVAAGSSLPALVKAYREKPTAVRRAAIEHFATQHSKDQDGALARLALGVTSFEQQNYDGAIRNLKAAQTRLTKVEDYAVYYLAAAQLQAKDEGNVPQELERIQDRAAPSPLAGKATVLAAKALVDLKNPAEAVRLLRAHYDALPQPDADLTLAMAYEAASDPNAAAYYQQVYFNYPDTQAAERASAALTLLKASMGAAYPEPTAAQKLERGNRWLAAHEYVRAKQEFTTLVSQLAGADRDMARVGMGVADYQRGEVSAAYRYLEPLNLDRSEADAERLYYLGECQRHINAPDEMLATVKRLSKEYPQSPWRLKALVSAGNCYLLQNRPDVYEAFYKAAYEDFPDDPAAPACHWKVAFSDYLHRRGDGAAKLREQIERYPSDPRTSASLYFLGRLSEAGNDFSGARAYYSKIVDLYPNYYYATRAKERLADTRIVAAQPSAKVTEYLAGVEFPARRERVDREPTAVTKLRIERGHLLAAAGLQDLAESELRFGARHDGQPELLAMELARTADSPYQGLRYMKSYAPDYLATPFEQMPRRFWELLFPMPYQADLVRNAKLQNIDPYMVAALIRQESEFNPKAISHKSACGLTQIMPATGRQLARKDGVRRFRTSMLFQPSTNLKLGSRYLRTILDEWGGKWEETLASYNAGKAHVDDWVNWNSFQEPAEFVETIPFTETREYVQAVLRNAAIYRRLYGTSAAASASSTKPAKSAAGHTGKRNRARATSQS
jgi:soluble lytic murein transglycosylase